MSAHNICPLCGNPDSGPRCRDHYAQTAKNSGKKKVKLVPPE